MRQALHLLLFVILITTTSVSTGQEQLPFTVTKNNDGDLIISNPDNGSGFENNDVILRVRQMDGNDVAAPTQVADVLAMAKDRDDGNFRFEIRVTRNGANRWVTCKLKPAGVDVKFPFTCTVVSGELLVTGNVPNGFITDDKISMVADMSMNRIKVSSDESELLGHAVNIKDGMRVKVYNATQGQWRTVTLVADTANGIVIFPGTRVRVSGGALEVVSTNHSVLQEFDLITHVSKPDNVDFLFNSGNYRVRSKADFEAKCNREVTNGRVALYYERGNNSPKWTEIRWQ